MKTRFKIDIATGVVTRSVAGVDMPEAKSTELTARDILECEVQFFAGETDVTAQVLSGTRKLLLGLRQFPSFGPKLAQSGPHTLVDGVANCILDLNTAEIVSLVDTLPTQATSTRVYFEVEVYEDDDSYRQTFAQVPFKLFCEVNEEADEPPIAAAVSAATATAQAVIATEKAGIATAKAAEAAASAASVDGPGITSRINSRAPMQGLVLDGTAGATLSNVPAFGTGDFTVIVLGNASALTTNSAMVGGNVGAFTLRINSSGNVRTGKVSTSDATYSTFAIAAGKSFFTSYRRASGQGYLGLNGTEEAAIADAVDYSAAVSLIGARTGSFDPWAGSLRVLIYNRALSAAEVAALYRDGRLAASDVGGAGLLANQTFTNYHYDTFSGVSAAGFTAVESGAQVSQATTAVGSGAYASPVGTKFRISFNATLTSGAVPYVVLGVASVGPGSSVVNVVNGTNTIELTQTVASTATNYLQVYFQTATDTAYSISGFTITRLGLLCYPDPQQLGKGSTWYDVSGNGAHITLPASGVSWALPWSGTLPGPLAVEIPVTWKPTVRIAESAAGSAHPAVELYCTTGAGTNYTGVRLVNDTGTLVLQTAPGAAIGSHTWTNRTTLDASGNLLTPGTLTAQSTGVHQLGGTLFVTGTDSKGSLVVRDNGLTSVGGAFTLLTNAGADTWRWGLRDSSGSLGANGELIFSRLDGSWSSPVKFAKEGDVELTTASKGVILKSPNGTRYRITVTDAGVVQATAA